jgi:hypothetical protein
MANSDERDAILLEQYRQVCASYRAIDDFRAKLLALLPFASGVGAITLLVNEETVGPSLTPIALLAVGVTIGLSIYEGRGVHRCKCLKRVTSTLEQELRLNKETGQFLADLADLAEPKPFLGFIREDVASVVVYLVVLLGWIYMAFEGGKS